MEKSEPTFVPEWLKGSGGGTTNHQTVSSSLLSDDHVAAKASRNKSSTSVNDNSIGRSFVPDRITSSYFRRSSSSNGSSHSRAQGNFSRRNRDRDWEKEIIRSPSKETHFLSDHRYEYSDPLSSILPSRFEKDLRRSQSMITGNRVDIFSRKMTSYSGNRNKSGSLQTGLSAINNVQKVSFERDFPSLGAEEKQASEIKRVLSPGTSVPSLTHGDTWTSALVEVPVLSASNVSGSVQPVTTPTVSLALSMLTGLNMAETVVQGSSRAQTPPELSAGTQRLEELAIKQSKQLIPVTPSMPKTLVLNSSEKTKVKLGLNQISSRLSSHSPRSAPVTPDLLKSTSVGKLQILKPARERNGTLQSSEDSSSPMVAVGSAPSERPLEKKLNPQARSRNDFFNLVRKKSIANPPSINSDHSGTVNSPFTPHEGGSPMLGCSVEDESSKGSDNKCNGNFAYTPKGFKLVLNEKDHSSSNVVISSEEEEAAFLRSLGWEDNGGEDEGLTAEEISSFLKDVNEYIKLRPPSKIVQAKQPKFLESLNSRYGSVGGGASSGSNSADSMLDS